MSTDYHIQCVSCGVRHYFCDANHQAPLMRRLIAHRETIAALAPLLHDSPELALRTFYGDIDASWFALHSGHELRVIDEYGRLDGSCEQRVSCDHCKTLHWCSLPHGHGGNCTP